MAAIVYAGGQRVEVLINANAPLEGTDFSFEVVSEASSAGTESTQVCADDRKIPACTRKEERLVSSIELSLTNTPNDTFTIPKLAEWTLQVPCP